MIVYKDRQFCTSSKCSEFGTCWRSFTPREQENAERWWKGFGLEGHAPVDMRSYENDKCYNPKMDK